MNNLSFTRRPVGVRLIDIASDIGHDVLEVGDLVELRDGYIAVYVKVNAVTETRFIGIIQQLIDVDDVSWGIVKYHGAEVGHTVDADQECVLGFSQSLE